ncbi:MAG: MFS transporter [Chloroflexota bacterium]|jgi:DHA1 family multidrug resistance protein-like MFS transporter
MSTIRADWQARISAWLRRWRPLLPVFAVQMIVTVGFGALLPVLPLYIQEFGIDAAGLGIIVAAWAVAKLIFEPVFGWWADRHSRKPQMVAGLVALAMVSVLPLFFTTFAAFVALRFLAGVSTAAYDPAARGMIVDATEEDERGEAFGFYGAFQIAGFVIGPAIGGLGSEVFGGYGFPFVFTSALSLVGVWILLRYLDPHPHAVESPEFAHDPEAKPIPAGDPYSASQVLVVPSDAVEPRRQAPIGAVFNRTVIAALVLAFGLYLTFGVYEVVWSIYLIALGASVAWVSLTFVIFGIPEMIMGPIAGRVVDRRGPVGMVIGSGAVILVAGAVYATAGHYYVPTLMVPIEAAATAAMAPALYSMLAQGTPPGRASTAQGLFGATSTLALVVASLAAGNLFEVGIGLPFWFFVGGLAIALVAGLAIYRSGQRAEAATGA